MKYFDWSEMKNMWLLEHRDISFEDIVIAIEEGRLLDEVQNKKKYSQQKIFIIQIADYIYLVPFVEDEAKIFLKAIIPSRKATKKYFKL